jgi:hypothetical protein
VYGPLRTVVWQGSAANRCPYADQHTLSSSRGRLRKRNIKHVKPGIFGRPAVSPCSAARPSPSATKLIHERVDTRCIASRRWIFREGWMLSELVMGNPDPTTP